MYLSTLRRECPSKAAIQHETTQLNGHIDAIPRTLEKDFAGVESSWVVQKFGGTGLGKFAVTIAEDIVL